MTGTIGSSRTTSRVTFRRTPHLLFNRCPDLVYIKLVNDISTSLNGTSRVTIRLNSISQVFTILKMLKLSLILLFVSSGLWADPVPAKVEPISVPVSSKPEGSIAESVPVSDVTHKSARTAAAAAAAALSNITFSSSGPVSCPPSHLFSPCECFVYEEKARIIRCSGEYNIDLNPIFQRLSIYLPKPDKHFHMFYLNNSNITYLGNVFHDITFEYICKFTGGHKRRYTLTHTAVPNNYQATRQWPLQSVALAARNISLQYSHISQ